MMLQTWNRDVTYVLKCYIRVKVILVQTRRAHWCYIRVTAVLHTCYSNVTHVLQWRYTRVSVMFLCSNQFQEFVLQTRTAHSNVTYTCYSNVTYVLQWCYIRVTVMLRGLCGTQFKGFLVQARRADPADPRYRVNPSQAVGTFQAVAGTKYRCGSVSSEIR